MRFTNAYRHLDHLGSLRIARADGGDPGASLSSAVDLYPYGREFTASTGASKRIFTGHEHDEETGIDYMLARYSSAAAGRFLSTDPRGDSALPQNSGSWNRYAYVQNAPIQLIDPTGEIFVLAGSAEAQKKFLAELNSKLKNATVVQDQKTGQLSAIVAPGAKLTNQEKQIVSLVNKVADDSKTTTITAVASDKSVPIAEFSTGTIDVDDVANIGDNSQGASAIGVLTHEIGEQYARQALGLGYPSDWPAYEQEGAHKFGKDVESVVIGQKRLWQDVTMFTSHNDGSVSGQIVIPYEQPTGSTTTSTINIDHGNVKK